MSRANQFLNLSFPEQINRGLALAESPMSLDIARRLRRRDLKKGKAHGLLIAEPEGLALSANVTGFVEARQSTNLDHQAELTPYNSQPGSDLVKDLVAAAHALGIARGLRLGRELAKGGDL